MSGVVNIFEGRDAILTDFGSLEERAHTGLKKFNNVKCKVLQRIGEVPCTVINWGMNGLRVALRRKICAYWWVEDWICTANVHLQSRKT